MSRLSDKLVKWLRENIYRYPNVKGFSHRLHKKITAGRVVDVDCIRIYVEKKVPLELLREDDVIPASIDGIPTDIVEAGFPEALGVDKTRSFRPVIMGISVGNKKITAGTIGALFEKKGEIYVGSNAHVLTPDPSKPPSKIREKRILQPGPYHIRQQGGNVDDPSYIVGEYVWHQRVVPLYEESTCPIAKGIAQIYNSVAKLLGAKTRLTPIVDEYNVLDYAVYRPTVEHEMKYPDIEVDGAKFIGLLFAGSKYLGIVCKAKYIEECGYYVVDHDSYEPQLFDPVYGTSFWCHYETKVVDDSAEIEVSYGRFVAKFQDVIFLDNKDVIRGGWSGSAWWFKEDDSK